jgi:hypothetical protein
LATGRGGGGLPRLGWDDGGLGWTTVVRLALPARRLRFRLAGG